ncbi:6-phosphogluconate dehydrogenase [Candidatus Saccharibacteria bacterium]|nr:MAG: 6-phosphogluconate dehydrogenase [Candidatus Saccharibacteria bacterium]PID99354.1 MAG: 6-phosphogluconate dehydrogenase [Candidatus Saccharibacteria bacterium]
MKLAIHGLGRMGMQIARKLAESGEHEVFAHNRSAAPMEEAASYGVKTVADVSDVPQALSGDRAVVWMMLPAEITEQIILDWTTRLPKDSIIINGANFDYRETKKLNEKVTAAGMCMIDIGVSGGVWGYQNGFPLMCGSDDEAAFAVIRPALETLIKPGGMYARFGSSGAGHYVKMIHNAIEYGMMQSLGEGFRMLHDGPYADQIDLAQAADLWQHRSVITSWLTELSRDALAENPELAGVSGYVAESGEARWTLEAAREMGIELPAIQAAFDVRLRSQRGETNFATKVVAAQRNKFGAHNLNGEGKA